MAAAPTVFDALVEDVLCSAEVESGEFRQFCALVADMMLRHDGFDLEMVRQPAQDLGGARSRRGGQLSAPREIISDAQLEALETRLEALHAAKLLSDDELGCLEDCVADGIEATSTCEVVTLEWVQSSEVVSKLHKLIVLSEKMPKDAMFARQARRKFGSA